MMANESIRSSRVAIVGVGGTGSHIVQQLARLGVGAMIIIDPDELEETNLNRLIGAHHDDPIPGTKKIDIAKRLVHTIDPSIEMIPIDDSVISKTAFEAIKGVDCLFGCVDNDGPRLILTELCAAFEIPYIDVSTEIILGDHIEYGGRVFCTTDENGCLVCMDEIDSDEARRYFSDPDSIKDEEAIYGVPQNQLGGSGPSVVSINGVVASLAVTEFLMMITDIRNPVRFLKYQGSTGKTLMNTDPPSPDCYYCNEVRGTREEPNINNKIACASELTPLKEKASVEEGKHG